MYAQGDGVYVTWQKASGTDKMIGTAVVDGETVTVTVTVTSTPGKGYSGYFGVKEANKIASRGEKTIDKLPYIPIFRGRGSVLKTVYNASGVENIAQIFETEKIKDYAFDGYGAYQYPNVLTFTFSKPVTVTEFFVGDVNAEILQKNCGLISQKYIANYWDDSFTVEGADFASVERLTPVTPTASVSTTGVLFPIPDEEYNRVAGGENVKFKKSKGNLESFVLKYRGAETKASACTTPTSIASSASNATNFYVLRIGNSCATEAPTITSPQIFCKDGATVGELTQTIGNPYLRWYDVASGGTMLPISTALVSGKTYYASQFIDCESNKRTPVEVKVGALPKPVIAKHEQVFCASESATVADLKAEGLNVKWYESKTSMIDLPTNRNLKNGEVYWGAQTSGTCMSPERDSVKVYLVDPSAGTISGTKYFCIGDAVQLETDGTPGGTWSSADETVATVDANTGLVTGVKKGSTQISYTVGTGTCLKKSSLEVFPLEKPEKPTFNIVNNPTCQVPSGSVQITNHNKNYSYEVAPSEPGVLVEAYTGTAQGFRPNVAYVIYATVGGSDCKSVPSDTIKFSADGLLDAPILEITEQATCQNQFAKVKIANYNPTHQYDVTPVFGVSRQSNIITLPAGKTYVVRAKTSACNSGGTSIEIPNVEDAPEKPILGDVVSPSCNVNTGSFTIKNYTSTTTVTFTLNDLTVGSSTDITPPVDMVIRNLLQEHTYTIKVTRNGCSSVSDEIVIPKSTDAVDKPVISDLVQPNCSDAHAYFKITNYQSGANVMYEITNLSTGIPPTMTIDDTGLAKITAPDTQSNFVLKVFKNGCESPFSDQFTVNPTVAKPDIPVGSIVTPLSCANPTAVIMITPQQGVEYSIDGTQWQDDNVFSGVKVGTYTLYVRAKNSPDCASQSTTPLEVKAAEGVPEVPKVEAIVQPDCTTPSGTITIVKQNGVQYSIDGTQWEISNVFSGLSVGKYTLYVRSLSDNTCIAVSANPVEIVSSGGAPSIPVLERVEQPECGSTTGGTIIITPQSNVEYSLDGQNWQVSNTFSNVVAGDYFLYVRKTGSTDCTAKSTVATTVTAMGEMPSVPTLQGEPIQPTCGNPKGIIMITQQSGVEYSIDKNNWQTGNIFIGLSAGNYKLYVRKPEAPNCIAESVDDVIINAVQGLPQKPETEGVIQPSCSSPSGTIIIKAQMGVEYSIDGQNWQTNSTFENIPSGTYSLFVRSRSDNSCIAVSDATVTIEKASGSVQKPELIQLPVQPDCATPSGTIIIKPQTGVEYSLDNKNWQASNTFSNVIAGSYFLYVRSMTNNDCVAQSDQQVTIKEAPQVPTKPVKESITQPTCDVPYGEVVIVPQSDVEYSLDNKIWQTANTFTKVPEGNYLLYVRSINGGCIAIGDEQININTPVGAPEKPTINDVATDNKIDALEKKQGVSVSGVAGTGDIVVVDFGGSVKTVTATTGTWSVTYTSNELPADGKITLTTKVEKNGCANQDTRIIEIDSTVPGDSDKDALPDDNGTLKVTIVEDTNNNGYIGNSELDGDIDYTITFPKDAGYNINDKLSIDIGQTYPLEVLLTQDMIDNGYKSVISKLLVKSGDTVTVTAYVIDNVGNRSKEDTDSAIIDTETPGDSDTDTVADKTGAMSIIINEDADNDGFIQSSELDGDIDYTITFPKNSGYKSGDSLDITIFAGSASSTISVTLTDEILAKGYSAAIKNTFTGNTKLVVKGIVKDKADNISLESSDQSVVILGAPGDSDGDGKPDEAGKPIVVITEDEDNNGFITSSELKGDINYTINFPSNSNYKAGDILVITQSVGVPFEVTLTDEIIEKGYNGTIPSVLVEDKDVVKVQAIVKDEWEASSLSGEDSAILKKTSEKLNAPNIEIVEDADNDGHITATEFVEDVDYTVTFSSTATYNVGDRLVITPSHGDPVVVELTDEIIKNGYKGTLSKDLFKDGDVLTIVAKINDASGNESVPVSDTADFTTRVPGDSDGDGTADANGSPIVVVTDDVNNDGYINFEELKPNINYLVTLPKNSGYKVGDKLRITLSIANIPPFNVKITDEILLNGYKGILPGAILKQGDEVKVTAKGVSAGGDAESLEAFDKAILDKEVPGDSDKDGKGDKYGVPEVVITEDGDNDGYINPQELDGDIDYKITFPLERGYTVGDTLFITVNDKASVEIILTDAMIKDGYVGTLPVDKFKNGDDITIKAKVKDPAGNESLEGSDTAILNKNNTKAPLVRIDEDIDNDGFINTKELQGDLDYSVLFPIKTNYKAGDKVSITTNLGTKEEVILTETIIQNGYKGMIRKDLLPKNGEVVVKAILVGTTDEASDSAVINTLVPGDSDGDGTADPNGSPVVVIDEDADNDGFIDKNELSGDVDYTVTLPKDSGYTVGNTLYVTPNVGGVVEVEVTQDILDNGYKGSLSANLFKDGDEVLISAKVEDKARNTSLTSDDKAEFRLIVAVTPTVLEQQTNKVLPIIKGTATSSSTVEVTVNGVTYREGDGNLVDNGNDTWELRIPVGNEFEEGTYDVVVKATDSASGKTLSDTTTNELVVDFDSDDDGIPDTIEGIENKIDTDNDGIPDYRDTDSDNDGIPDNVEAGEDPIAPIDTDKDGIPDYRDTDSDNDGIPDSVEAGEIPQKPIDTDNDGIPDYRDIDSDNDRISDSKEAGENPEKPVDTDKDGAPDYRDADSDNDTIPDSVEVGNDADNPVDTDNDGIPDYKDTDSDDDTIPDRIEAGEDPNNPVDTDSDGIPDYKDTDSDNDKIPDNIEIGRFPENPSDVDKDGTPDFRDTDSDGDGMSDTLEAGENPERPVDTDGDGTPDFIDADSDNDGIPDNVEVGKDTAHPVDTDGDTIPDYLDLDSDNDSVNDIWEVGLTDANADGMVDNPNEMIKDALPDGDVDGIPDYRELDSNNNGKFDIEENPNGDPSKDMNKDGIVDDKNDTDKDGIMDSVDGKVNEFGDALTTLPKLDAVDDSGKIVVGDEFTPIVVLANDTKDGKPIFSIDEVDVTVVENKTNDALKLIFENKQAKVVLGDNIQPGNYRLIYRIAQKLNPNNYDDAVVTVVVENRKLDAVDDDYSKIYIEQGKPNYNIGDVYENDLLGGEFIDRSKMILTMGEVTLNGKSLISPKVGINRSGIVSSSSEAEAGVYILKYRICEKNFPNNCDEAIVKVVISTDCKSLIENMKVPQQLTVNYDKTNDTWELPELLIYHRDCEKEQASGVSNKVMIFNRWGMKVYEKENYMFDEERFEGFSISSLDFADYEDMPSGVYFYVVQVNGLSDKTGYLYVTNEKN